MGLNQPRIGMQGGWLNTGGTAFFHGGMMKTRLLVWWENKGARVNCIPTGGSSSVCCKHSYTEIFSAYELFVKHRSLKTKSWIVTDSLGWVCLKMEYPQICWSIIMKSPLKSPCWLDKKHILQSENHMKLVHVGYTCHVWFVPPWLMLKFPTWIQAVYLMFPIFFVACWRFHAFQWLLAGVSWYNVRPPSDVNVG